MRRLALSLATLLVALALAGCGSNTQTAQETSSDSLLAMNPSEQASGDLTPQTEYQPAEDKPEEVREPVRKPSSSSKPRPSTPSNPGVTVPAGTAIPITVSAQISSETAQPGDSWTGVVKDPVIIGTHAPIPAGSMVEGVVSGVRSAEKGSRAVLVLSVTAINVDGKRHVVRATADSIIAGSTRARNVGAVAGGAAAGALLGKAVSGSGKGAVIGGILGGAAATGAVAASKGYQATVKEGAELTFTVDESVVMK